MCRLLGLQADADIDVAPWIAAFSQRCRESKEYQGHGWGVAWWDGSGWQRYRTVDPIWTDDFVVPPTSLAVVHARSAFRNEGVVVENNMPFHVDQLAFAFNGELHGVRLPPQGDTGAARLMALLNRFHAAADGDLQAALARLNVLVSERSEYVRAMNIIVSDGRSIFVNTHHSEDPDYFTLHAASLLDPSGLRVVCSERLFPMDAVVPWIPIPNHTTCLLSQEALCFS